MPSVLPYICFIGGIGAFYLHLFFPLAAVLLFLLSACLLFRYHGREALIYAALVLVAFGYAWFRYTPPEDTGAAILETGGSRPFTAAVAGLPLPAGRGYLQEVHLREPEVKSEVFLRTVSPLPPGSRIEGFAYMSAGRQRMNPGSPLRPPSLFLRTEGTVVLSREDGWVAQRMRWRLYNWFRENLSPDAASLLSAVVIGHRGGGDELYTAYRKVGLAHLMSISGTHFGLLSVLVFSLIRHSARLLPYRWLARLTARVSLDGIAVSLTLPLMILYLLLSGGRVPALRSFVMTGVFLLGLLIGRRGRWLQSLLLAAVVILLMDPGALWTVSFQLSFTAVLFIGLTLEAFGGTGFERHHPAVRRLLLLILVTGGALIGTAPLLLYYFHTFPVLSLPANLVFTPAVCFLVLPLGLLGGLTYLATGYFPLSGVLQGITGVVNSWVVRIAGYGSTTIPLHAFPAVVLIFVYPCLYFLLRRRWRWSILSSAALAATLLVTVASYDWRGPRVTFLDVGQGDAAVIETAEGRTIVVDTGYSGREVVDYLRYKGIGEVDALVLTHADGDHSGGLWNLLSSLRVKEVWDNGLLRYRPGLGEGIIHRRLRAGELISSGGGGILALHPGRGYYSRRGAEENNHSLVLRFQEGGLSVLFTADIEADAEEALLGLGGYLESDVLKVAHHGSYTSSTRAFVDAVGPEAAVISAGRGNPYGHPHETALRRLSGIPLYRTDTDGAVRVALDREGRLRVERFRDRMLKRVKGFAPGEELANLRRLFLLW